MKIKWLGHACFILTAQTGLRIITDPYTSTPDFKLQPVNETADIVTISHDHGDHNNVEAVRGKPEIARNTGINKLGGIEFKGIQAYHDTFNGTQRGGNVIWCFNLDGIKLCHLGDLGHRLGSSEIDEIGDVDIVMIPVGGLYTIDASMATQISDDLKPKIVIPMHYKTAKIPYPIAKADDFIRGKSNVRQLKTSEMELEKADLPKVTEIIVFQSDI